MKTKPADAEGNANLVTAMLAEMNACTTVGELLTLAQSGGFGEVYALATPDDQQALRDNFDARRIVLSGRVKLAEIKGERVTVISTDIIPTVHGEAVSMKGTRANGAPFSLMTSGVAILRHFRTFWDKLPAQYVFTQDDVHPDDPTMSPMWKPNRVPEQPTTRLPWNG